MATLTETRVEIADRHTTLCFLSRPPALGALGQHDYRDLYRRVASIPSADFRQISAAAPEASALDRLEAVGNWHNRRFWREYLGTESLRTRQRKMVCLSSRRSTTLFNWRLARA